MGRTRSFDERAVLSKAMHLFRRKGFSSVSVADLETTTGLTVGSLYNAFGDKQGMFDAAFAHYTREVLERRIARYAPPESGLAGLRALFLTLLEEPLGTSFGCLITNTAIEFGGQLDANRAVDRAFSLLTKTFEARTSRTVAVRLLALYQGILVLVRAGYSSSKIRTMIKQEFDNLEDQL